MGKVFRDRFNRADGALGSLPVGKSALAVIVGGGTHESYTAPTYGWTVTTIDITTGGVWPSRATIATYDLLIIDAGYNGIDATGQTNAANAYTDGVSVYTTGNDTTAMSPLFTGSASDNAYDNNQYPNGTHALAAGWSVFGDGDLGIYLTGVNGSAVTFMTTQIAAGQWVATGVAMENTLTGARWVHVQPYAATHPAGLDATVYGWLSETKWQTNKPWMVLSGAFSITSNEITSSTAPGSNPLAVIDVGVRMNGKNDVDVSATPRHVYGNAVYVRVVDASNFVRARVQSWTNTYYVTEYLYTDYEWNDHYDARRLQREVRTTTTTTNYVYQPYQGWTNTGETTACRIDQPTYGLTPIYGPDGQITTQYRWVSNGLGVGCAADKATYRKQSNTRTYTTSTTYNYTYRWVDDGYVCGSNENFTGATQTVSVGPYAIWSTNPEAATNPGKTTTASGAYDAYVNTTLDAHGSYYSTYAYNSNDVNTGATRQAGPYTDYYYGQVVLEKCVAGTFTQLGSYDSGSTAQQVLRLRAKDSTLQVYYGGTLRITATDAAHATTGTKVGVGGGASAYNATTPRLDDFSATLLTPYRVRNAADTAWINVERPKIRNAADTAWIDYDPKGY